MKWENDKTSTLANCRPSLSRRAGELSPHGTRELTRLHDLSFRSASAISYETRISAYVNFRNILPGARCILHFRLITEIKEPHRTVDFFFKYRKHHRYDRYRDVFIAES